MISTVIVNTKEGGLYEYSRSTHNMDGGLEQLKQSHPTWSSMVVIIVREAQHNDQA